MESNTEKYFPSVYDEYYYYCRISIVEEAKERYMKCNSLLLGSGITDSPVMKLLESEIDEKKQVIYSKYEKLYHDFITYSDKLINKENVESQDDYIRCMQNLMRISNETIVFTYENFGAQKNKMLGQKWEYSGKKTKLSDIIDQNRNIPYILNPDEITTVIANKYYSVFVSIVMFVMFIIGLIYIPLIAKSKNYSSDYSVSDICSIVMLLFLSIGFTIAGLTLLVTRIKYKKNFRLIEIKSNAHSRNRYLVLHPYTTKFSLKNIKEIVGIVRTLIK